MYKEIRAVYSDEDGLFSDGAVMMDEESSTYNDSHGQPLKDTGTTTIFKGRGGMSGPAFVFLQSNGREVLIPM